MHRPLLAAVVLVSIAGCSEVRQSPHETARAAGEASALGQTREAVSLYRDAARRGDVWAQINLGDLGRARRSLGDWMFEPRPSPTEAARWAETANTTAAALVAAGDPQGHLAFASIALFEAQKRQNEGAPAGFLYAAARRHADAAAALGNRDAVLTRAFVVSQTDGLLAAEPFFREAARAGFPQAVSILSIIATNRPLLEQDLRPRDAAGDLTRIDVVAGLRVLQTSGLAGPRAEAAEKIQALRDQARTGNAEADSLLRALDTRDIRA